MLYEGDIYRPPSEAYSVLIQVTVGCSHNKCTFCNSYREKHFHIRTMEDIEANMRLLREHYPLGSPIAKKLFLTDGDALCLSTNKLLEIISYADEIFPDHERICAYGSAMDLLRKSVEDLQTLKNAGLDIIYLGCESGNDQVLEHVCKGVTRQQQIDAIRRLRQAGLRSSVTYITGLGGKAMWREHAIDSATQINEANPDYVSFLTFQQRPGAPINDEIARGEFQLLTPAEVLDELELVFEHLHPEGPCVFRSNHASNYLVLAGTLPQDTRALLEKIRYARDNMDVLRPEFLRRYRG